MVHRRQTHQTARYWNQSISWFQTHTPAKRSRNPNRTTRVTANRHVNLSERQCNRVAGTGTSGYSGLVERIQSWPMYTCIRVSRETEVFACRLAYYGSALLKNPFHHFGVRLRNKILKSGRVLIHVTCRDVSTFSGNGLLDFSKNMRVFSMGTLQK